MKLLRSSFIMLILTLYISTYVSAAPKIISYIANINDITSISKASNEIAYSNLKTNEILNINASYIQNDTIDSYNINTNFSKAYTNASSNNIARNNNYALASDYADNNSNILSTQANDNNLAFFLLGGSIFITLIGVLFINNPK